MYFHLQIAILQIFPNFSQVLHRIRLFYPEIENFEDFQLGIIPHNFGNVMNCQCTKLLY